MQILLFLRALKALSSSVQLLSLCVSPLFTEASRGETLGFFYFWFFLHSLLFSSFSLSLSLYFCVLVVSQLLNYSRYTMSPDHVTPAEEIWHDQEDEKDLKQHYDPTAQDAFGNEEEAEVKYKVLKWW